jgi:hypothetical protein
VASGGILCEVMMAANSESLIQGEILEYLRLRGVFCWRNNSGVARTGGRFIRFGSPGAPDILGILPDGRFLGIEVKTPTGIVSEDQEAFHEAATRSGALVFTAWSLDCARAWLDDILAQVEASFAPD